jgi:hypothetical protein
MKTWFSQTIGDDEPRPGISAFHFTFLVSFHSVGGFAVNEPPLPVGPRQLSQLSAHAHGVDKPTNSNDVQNFLYMTKHLTITEKNESIPME